MRLTDWQQHVVTSYLTAGKSTGPARSDELIAQRDPSLSRVLQHLHERGRTKEVMNCSNWLSIERLAGSGERGV